MGKLTKRYLANTYLVLVMFHNCHDIHRKTVVSGLENLTNLAPARSRLKLWAPHTPPPAENTFEYKFNFFEDRSVE